MKTWITYDTLEAFCLVARTRQAGFITGEVTGDFSILQSNGLIEPHRLDDAVCLTEKGEEVADLMLQLLRSHS